MAGRGPAPSESRRRTNAPERGDWQASPTAGWQHGEIPPCPVRGKRAVETWSVWMASWFAAHWLPEDLPVLELVIKLWARADNGRASGSERSELRQLMDSCGITRKGQQDRRWTPPKAEDETATVAAAAAAGERYAHLRVAK